jgi:hypothetical protein
MRLIEYNPYFKKEDFENKYFKNILFMFRELKIYKTCVFKKIIFIFN